MSIVKINAITVPEPAREEFERRFAARKGAVDREPGFEGFQLLRPTSGEERYFVLTWWADEESFAAWRDGNASEAHSGQQQQPVATDTELMGFDVVLDSPKP